MNNNKFDGRCNGNQDGAHKARFDAGRGGKTVGHPIANAQTLGVRPAHPARPDTALAAANTCHGGQRALGLFGITSQFNGAQTPKQPVKPSRVRGALNYFDTDGLEVAQEEARARAATTAAMERAARESREREEREWLAAARAEEEASYATFLTHWFPHCQALRAEEGR